MNGEILPLVLQAALKGSLLILIAVWVSYLCRKQSASVRHSIWSAALLCALALPLVILFAPEWGAAMADMQKGGSSGKAYIEPSTPLAAMVITARLQEISSHAAAGWMAWAWMTGCGIGLALLMIGTVRLTWTEHRATVLLSPEWMKLSLEMGKKLQLARPVRLLVSAHGVMPVTWGFTQPRVLLPAGAENWPVERMRIVLAHEFAHVKRGDWLLQMIAEGARALYWFNPLVWICCNRLRQESEQACDDAVLLSGIDAPDYAEHLLELARTLKTSERPWAASLAMARRSHLERRFAAMLNPDLNRRKVTRPAGLLITLAAVCLLIPLASLRAPAQSLSGKVFGTVYDVSGGAIPNATVIAINPEGRTKDMTTSNAAGMFEFGGLPAGNYVFEVLKPGFARATLPVQLQANQGLTQNVTLQLGSVNEQIEVRAQGAKPAVTPSSAQPPQRIRIGGNIQATKVVNMVRPLYPPVAKAAGIQGAVLLEAVISREGEPMSLRVMNSQIDPDLARAAVEAVSQWRYQPTLLNGQPVEILTAITVNFTLE